MEIQGFDNYLIYPDGTVWSKTKNMFLKTAINNGYLIIKLTHNKEQKTKKLHRLIAENYIPNPDNKLFVDHKNRDRKDNRIENLRWVTSSENNLNMGIKKHNTTGFKWISPWKNNKGHSLLRFSRVNCSRRTSKELSKLLCYSFFYLLKYPIEL